MHNTALISAQRPEVFGDVRTRPDAWGRIVESAIDAHLVNHSLTQGYTLHYWRERNEEVDFVLEHRGKVIALEVKTTMARSTAGINTFQKQWRPAKVLLVGSSGLSWQEFLKLSPAQLFTA